MDNRLERRRNQVTREEFDKLVAKVHENTEITLQVHNILTSFKVMLHIGKWVTVIASMFAAIGAAWHSIKGG